MSYTKQNFTNGQTLTAEHLNHIEAGIVEAEKTGGSGGSTSLTIGTVTTGSTAAASIVNGKLNLTLPKGDKGDTGSQGAKGDTGPGITATAKSLILELFTGAAYGNTTMQTQLDALKTEWGTSGGNSGSTTEEQNTDPFPDVGAAYLLPTAKTFVPAKKEFIDTGLKLFEKESPGNWTLLFELQCGEALVAKSDTYVVAHCMEESTPWPGFTLQVSGTSMQCCYFSGKGNLATVSELKTAKHRIAARFKETAYTGGQSSGNLASWGSVTGYTTVNKSLILGAYQQSDGTKGRFFDGTLYQCIVYNSALSDDQLREWLAG